MTLRDLPSVDEITERLRDVSAPRALIVSEVRREIEAVRSALREGRDGDPASVEQRVRATIDALAQPSLRRVINATGVVLHTNLGRAPSVRFAPIEGYSNLEYDLSAGRRGKRDSHV